MREVVASLRAAGLCVLPACKDAKCPTRQVGSWKRFQSRMPTDAEMGAWLANRPGGLCVLCGAISGNLEMLDFDNRGELFDPWAKKIPPALLERLVIETTPSGGWHVYFRSSGAAGGNMRLAQKRQDLTGEETFQRNGREFVRIGGKPYQVRVDDDGVLYVVITQIETRGEGGLSVCDPTPGYALTQGDLAHVPVLTAEERETLLRAAWELNTYVPPSPRNEAPSLPSDTATGDRPGDDFNARGDLRPLLEAHGWRYGYTSGENDHWRRPGKDHGTCSATFHRQRRTFFVFSSNAQPFTESTGYSPFQVYSLLEHEGDFTAAAAQLRSEGYGHDEPSPDGDVDLSGLLDAPTADASQDEDVDFEVLSAQPPVLHPPIIHGLLREGETMNLIAAPKTGKSWLAGDLAMAVARGSPWLGTFPTERGRVLIVDNELHRATSRKRLLDIAAARNIDRRELFGQLAVRNLRGSLRDLERMGGYFRSLEAGRYRVIILDAFYRFLPMGMDENDNASMANLYNQLDRHAAQLGCAFVLIHHTSKGPQAGKSVTDVGAGAGAQARATDAHAVLRRHKEPNAVVLDAAVRSWPPVQPVCLRWSFPVWNPAPDLDPADLEGAKPRRETTRPQQQEGMTAETFARSFVTDTPRVLSEILSDAVVEGMSQRRARDLLAEAEGKALVHRWRFGANRRVKFATVPQPLEERSDP